jgi:DNA-binding MarR family transcriptional regulator
MNTPCICTNLRLATRKLSAIYDAALEPLGINIAQYFLLRIINNHQAVSLTEVGRLAELDRSTIGRNVRVLERMGLVETGRSEADQREALVSLTRDGRDLMRKAVPIWESCQQSFVSRLGRDKIEALGAVIDAI